MNTKLVHDIHMEVQNFYFWPEQRELLDSERKALALYVPSNYKQVSLFKSGQGGQFGGYFNCPYLLKIPSTKQNGKALIMKTMLSKTKPQATDKSHSGARRYLKRDN